MSDHLFKHLTDSDLVLDALPDEVEASIQIRNRYLKSLPSTEVGLEFVVADLSRWAPGETVRVAFLGGTSALHGEIVAALEEVTTNCGLDIDFGYDSAAGTYRTWSRQDNDYVAEIRIGFELGGYFSLVGTDSVNMHVGSPLGTVGGRPNQQTLNLGGFHVHRPALWKGTTRHEFLHALGFHHEHQNTRGPCEEAFRWDDDAGYVPTLDPRGRYIVDSVGRQPGIYTFLAGYPNNWSRAKVDHNLRTADHPDHVVSVFDPKSIMLYQFPQLFYKTPASSCMYTGDGESLSDGDLRGLDLLYPLGAVSVAPHAATLETNLEIVAPMAEESLGLEAAGVDVGAGVHAVEAARILRERLSRI